MRFGPYFALLNGEFEHVDGEIVTEAYLDSNGTATGPGGRTTNLDGSRVQMGQTWTKQEALEMYATGKEDFAEDVWNLLAEKVRPQLKQHQFDALGVLAWNIGIGAFADSSALRMINEGRFEDGFSKFLLWRRETLRGGKPGPDGLPARDPQDKPMPEGQTWFKASRGIYRRSISAALLGMGHNWKFAAAPSKIVLKSYPLFVEAENRWVDRITKEMDWKEILASAKDHPLPVIAGTPDPEVFDEKPITNMERLQYESVKAAGADETLEEYVAHRRGVAITPMTKKVPVEAIDYLDPKDKVPGNITVKRIEDSRRGKGFAKSEIGKVAGVGGVGVLAAEQVGVVEPVVKFVEKYSWGTIVWVALILLVAGIVLHYYGKWEREEGEDGAEDLLG